MRRFSYNSIDNSVSSFVRLSCKSSSQKICKEISQSFNYKEKLELISNEDVLSKICVSRPYFAFEEIYHFGDGILVSKITPEQPMEGELGPITMAEAGRHIAILGSCAHAMDEKEKFFYLADEAKMTLRECFNKDFGSLYVVIKNRSFFSKKRLGAFGFIMNNNGDIVYDLEVKYQKLGVRVFQKVFSSYHSSNDFSDISYITGSPYKREFNFGELSFDDTKLTTVLKGVDPLNCSGHFSEYPMLPVAISVYLLNILAGKLFCKINGISNYKIDLLDLKVYSPIKPQDHILLSVEYDSDVNKYCCSIQNLSGNKLVVLELQLLK